MACQVMKFKSEKNVYYKVSSALIIHHFVCIISDISPQTKCKKGCDTYSFFMNSETDPFFVKLCLF